jgi:SAM-dependent methyltransferase
MTLTSLLNRISRRVFDHRTYRRRAVDRWLRTNRSLLAGRVLDVGSKKKAAKGLFALELRQGDCWIALDIGADSKPDVVGRGERLPFRGGTFDAVVCSEVVEHVEEPAALIAELYRVLRDGGHLLLSSPFMFPIHGDPHDYQRLTETRLRQLLRAFAEVEISASGYFPSVAGDVLRRALHGTSRCHFYKYLFYPLLPLVHLLVLCERWPVFRKLYGWEGAVSGYLVLATK